MLSRKQKILFFENLWNLINAWIPIIQALNIIIFQTKNIKIKNFITSIKKDVEAWENLFKVSLKYKKFFSIFDMAMFEVWEATWKLGKSLDVIAKKEDKEMALKNKIRQALIYPAAIVIVTISMITVMMIYVIPKIENIYKDANTNLPPLTVSVINFSKFIRNNWIFVLLWIIAFIIIFHFLLKKKEIKVIFDKILLDIPIFWEIIKKKILVSFCDFLSTLLSSWIIINKSILILRNGETNLYYSNEYEKILEDVKNWKNLSYSMWWNLMELKNKQNLTNEEKQELVLAEKRSRLFPIELTTSIKIWEQTWTLSKMLEKSSDRYTKEIDNVVKNLSTMLEPIIIVVIWVVVWTIIMAILLPFLNMWNVIK